MVIKAKRPGTCGACGLPISVGQLIHWARDPGWVVTHYQCHSDPEQPKASGRVK